MWFSILEQQLLLLPERCIYWQQAQALVMSDLHLGKVTHFRKNGIQVPLGAIDTTYQKLEYLFEQYMPLKWIIVGDLFHSSLNNEWELFSSFCRNHPNVEVILIRGNHDILPAYLFKNESIKTVSNYYLQPFLFEHHPSLYKQHYLFAGHVHPGVSLKGKARQTITVPCFYFGKKMALLPAFGTFTGLEIITPKIDDRLFVIANKHIIEL